MVERARRLLTKGTVVEWYAVRDVRNTFTDYLSEVKHSNSQEVVRLYTTLNYIFNGMKAN